MDLNGFLCVAAEGFLVDMDVVALRQLVFDLQYVTAGLATRKLSQVVVIEINILSVLEQAIKVVGKDGLFFSVSRQTTFLLDEIGNETPLQLVCGQNALVDTQHVQSLEIDVARFQKAHDLQSVGAAAIEFDGNVDIQQLEQNLKVVDVFQVTAVTFRDKCNAVDALPDSAHLVEQKQQLAFSLAGLYLVGYELYKEANAL